MSRRRITPRQYQIVKLIADGFDTEGIARELGLGKWTVKDHIRRLCREYDCPMTELPGKTGIGQQR